MTITFRGTKIRCEFVRIQLLNGQTLHVDELHEADGGFFVRQLTVDPKMENLPPPQRRDLEYIPVSALISMEFSGEGQVTRRK